MKYFAHRGIINNEIENSKHAILNTFTSNDYNGVEIDLRMTHDKKIILFHDESTKRISNKNFKINDTQYSILKKIELEDGSHLLSLQQFFNIYKKYKTKQVIFDVKDNNEYIISKILYYMDKHKINRKNIIILVWDKNVLINSENNINKYYAVDGTTILSNEIKELAKNHYKGITVKFDNSKNNLKSINLIKKFKLNVGVYTLKENLINAKNVGNIDGITF